MLVESGAGEPAELDHAAAQAEGLGLFIRGLVGLDRDAATDALSGFIAGRTLTANQIDFVNLIITYLTEHGVMDVARLYETPFTDHAPAACTAVSLPDGPRSPGHDRGYTEVWGPVIYEMTGPH